jgi:stage III sporulation protein SpoIIIAA
MQREKPWGKAPHSVEERFNKMYQEYSPEYFIVTEMGEYKEQPELREFLATHFALLPGEERYRIFDLRKRPASSR